MRLYQSTRGDRNKISSAEAIVSGQAKDGGLYVPESFPDVSLQEIIDMVPMSYSERAAYIMNTFLTDFSINELEEYSTAAYRSFNQRNDNTPAPLYELNENTLFLELWHGPTCAFKDIALQIMPYLLTNSLKKIGEERNVCILTATSGDTGKAALEGFANIPGTKIMVFFPDNGVSEVQKLQMTTQTGDNVNVFAIKGNFDDVQTGVKSLFSDAELNENLDHEKYILSSANSINWGRLVPQTVYYFSVYCDLIKSGKIMPGDKVNFCVPTGNFGNILAGYYAERMGLPVSKLICASNSNDVLTQFINTGVYDKNRPFYTTVSPSMDILVSSNLERLLFELSGKDGGSVKHYMSSLSSQGQYRVPGNIRDEMKRIFASGYCSEEDTIKTINKSFTETGYLPDTHTAVAVKVLNDYRNETGDRTTSVIVSTADPFKFCDAVLSALGKPYEGTGFEMLEVLSEASGRPIPAPLASLKTKSPRFNDIIPVTEMKNVVKDFIRGR